MASNKTLTIVRGNTVKIPIRIKTATYRYFFTIPTRTISPVVGSKYRFNEIFFLVTEVNGNQFTMQSNTLTDVLPATGSLSKTSGTGDSTINYTAKSSTRAADITGMTVNVIVISKIQENPTGSDIIIPKKSITVHNEPYWGLTQFELTISETATLPVGVYVGVVELVDSSGAKVEQTDNQTFIVEIEVNKLV